MRRLLAAFVLACALPFVTGCTVNPATGERSFTAFMSPAEEVRVGAQEHPKLVKQFGGRYDDPELAAYVTRIGATVAQVTEFPEIRYSFTLLNDEKVNAFALPGGYVHITRGLLALANSEAEVASVLAHEIGHVTARHSAQRYSQAMVANLGLAILGAAGAAAGTSSGVGDLAAFGAQAYLQGFSREQEFEADMLGIRYMSRAGYDPAAMVSFFRKLDGFTELQAVMAGDPGAANRFSIMASHPRTGDRVAQAFQLARGTAIARPRPEEDYLARIDGMLFGDHPSQGVRRGRDFLHPALGFAFRVPPGFVMFNSARQLVARGPGKSLIAFDAADPRAVVEAQSMSDYVGRVWGGRLGLQSLERITVNSMDGATGAARLRTNSGTSDVRLVAIQERQNRVYRFLFVTPAQLTGQLATELQRTTFSFRRLSAAEAAAIKPLRLRIVTVRSGDTPETFAEQMPFAEYRLERFLALNGLPYGARLQPDQRVKIVTDR